MGSWQMQQAKARLSELVDEAQKDHQFITSHGRRKAVVLSIADYEKLAGMTHDLKSHLLNFPDAEFPQIPRCVDRERNAKP